MKNNLIAIAWLSLLSVFASSFPTAQAQGTAFTYQGRLNANGAAANGSYDLSFTLYSDSAGGAVLAGPVTNTATAVTNGLFTTLVDFGHGVFVGGSKWLALAVSTNGVDAFTTLSPRQQVTPTPYALAAGSAATVSGTVDVSQLRGSIPAASISGTLNPAQLPASVLTTNGVAAGLTSSTLSSIAPGSVVARQYLDYVGSTNINNWMAIQTWGDSLTEGSGVGGVTSSNSYPAQLSTFSGFRVANGGVGGETAPQILVRQTAASNTWYQPTIIWAGRNEYWYPTNVLNGVSNMVANLRAGGNTNRFLVLSVLNGTYSGDERGGANYQIITNINAQFAAAYGPNYLDVRSYLVTRYNPSIAQDVLDYANDIPPSSLRYDGIHLNSSGYPAVAAYILTNGMATLRGAWGPTVNPSGVTAILRQPPSIGSEVPAAGTFTTLSASTLSVTNLGLNTTTPVTQFQIKQLTTSVFPTLGVTGGSFSILVPNNNYGLFAGVTGPGPFYMQVQRNDSAVAYDLQLQPAGGSVAIGTTLAAAQKLTVGGTVGATYYISSVTNGTPPLFVTSTTKVANLNADSLDGLDSTAFQTAIRRGTATLVAGNVTVSDTNVTATTIIMLTGQNSSGAAGELTVSARTAGASFKITSTSSTDTRLIGYMMIEP